MYHFSGLAGQFPRWVDWGSREPKSGWEKDVDGRCWARAGEQRPGQPLGPGQKRLWPHPHCSLAKALAVRLPSVSPIPSNPG